MKTTFFSLIPLLVAGLFSIAPAEENWAPVATAVAVSIDHTSTSGGPDVVALPTVGLNLGIFKDVKAKQQTGLQDKGEKQWFVLNIPLVIHARGRVDGKLAPARYVDELHLHVYLLTTKPASATGGKGSGKGGSSAVEADHYYLFEKEIVLQDIPLERNAVPNDKGVKVSKAEVPVGIFIPRATVFKITEKSDTSAFTRPGCIAGYAVLASFHGVDCTGISPEKEDLLPDGETSKSKLYSKKLVNKMGKTRWWTERASAKIEKPGFPLMCISETPYANYYGLLYPATKPILGAPDSNDASSTENTDNSDSSSGASETVPFSPSSSSSSSSSSTRSSSGTSSTL